jgi:hypothetical protein
MGERTSNSPPSSYFVVFLPLLFLPSPNFAGFSGIEAFGVLRRAEPDKTTRVLRQGNKPRI